MTTIVFQLSLHYEVNAAHFFIFILLNFLIVVLIEKIRYMKRKSFLLHCFAVINNALQSGQKKIAITTGERINCIQSFFLLF